MRTSSSADKMCPSGTTALVYAAAFLTAALMLSLAEALLLPTGLFPIPGAKPGLANAAVLLCAKMLGRKYAAAVSFARVLLMFFLFGSATSFMYSLSGAICSLILISMILDLSIFSYLGKSMAAAVCHNLAQLICATLIIDKAVLFLAPYMILSGVVCGAFTGFVLNLCSPALIRAFNNSLKKRK